MGKTQKLRRIVFKLLKELCNSVYYQTADTEAPSTYIVYDLANAELDDTERDDIRLTIDVWGLRTNTAAVDDILDDIDNKFNCLNYPECGTFPTFYREHRDSYPDEDKAKYRGQIKFVIQTYEE